ncbi:DUF1993 domain-containing protein [Chitinilyticum piscinae]|uniref:DUF1993 domain-containing protein n=1 Tax=Chitinilyticum piscinae TaxID=2866724 RepID=A0A8J7K1R2_9NEIS|nr:DUF1993 domain-containing protein [Chitinilyticum piscinae]MBE9609581.1 DUF1993 domain-containing protein [Chitinilyticum piscinae]
MSLSHYKIIAPTCHRMLANLSAILASAEAWAIERKIEPQVLLQSRLAPDMYPLLRQVQIVSDVSKGALARLAGQQAPSFADEETTFAELQQRITRTQSYIESLRPDDLAQAGEQHITLPWLPDSPLQGDFYLLHFALPNLYFHVSMAYAILRHNGVPLGKADYLGNLHH